MQFLIKILPYIQIILSILLVIAILLQSSGASVGGALGGGDGDSFHRTRRGFEKFLFYFSIVCAILFALLAFVMIILKAKS
jgi:protein translocase SecG subunit